MVKYYTRACNFNYGFSARQLIKKKKSPTPYAEIKIYPSAKLKFLPETKVKYFLKKISLKKINSLSIKQRKR